ncbi:MAG: PAS domain S-box protein, partial [Crocinitomicaceae bacterium]
IWLPFSLVLFSVFALLIVYNSYKQEEIYLNNRKSEVNKLAKTLVKQIKIGIEEEDFESIKKSLEIAKSSYGFEMVKLELGEISINYPENSNDLKFNKDELMDEDYPFNTVLGKAELCFITSTKHINEVITKNNESTIIIFLVVFLCSSSIFLWFTLKISKPFKDLVSLANRIESQDYREDKINLPDTKEIQILYKSLVSLMDSLKSREEFKDNLLNELEIQVKAQTQELNQLSLVAKHTTNGVVITDKDRKIIWVNKSFEKLTGYSLEEVKGKTPKLFQFEKTDRETITRINKHLSENKIVNEEILNRAKDGREYWLDLNIVPILNKENETQGFIAVEIDITEKKNREDLIKKSEEDLRQILNNSSEMIHTMDLRGNLIWANKSWLNKIEVTLDEIIGKPLSQFLSEETMVEFQEVIPKVIRGEKIDNLDCVFLSVSGKEIKLKGKSIPIIENGIITASQAYLHDVTDIIAAQKEIIEMSQLQKLAIDISNRFINLPIEEYEETVLTSLKELSDFVGADRGYIYNLSKKSKEYIFSRGSSTKDVNYEFVQHFSIDSISDTYNKHRNGEIVISDITLTNEIINNEKLMYSSGVKGTISIPVIDSGELIAFIGFDVYSNDLTITKDELDILKLFAQMLINVNKRFKYIDELNQSKLNIQKMNETLESKVLENTKRNLDLSKSLVEQDKLATIGEISAGIAHDLNTPLGTIRVGADNVRFMIDHLLTKELNSLSSEDLKFIHHNAPTRDVENFIGGLQLRKEKAQFLDFLKSQYDGLDEQFLNNIAELMVKARISVNDDEIIKRIFSSSNPLLFADVFYQIYQACNQLETIKGSSDKAVKVVQDVRSFIKGETSQNEKRLFNLKENISTVLGVFRYELEHGVDLRFEIDPSFEMVGFDVKLFQLWSNLLKNAIEAMDEQEQKYIGIFSKIEDNRLQISFENNGPKIPNEVQENMFKKFYTTKEKKSGSGLGLSIVNNILTDHNASIDVFSDDEITRFTVTFDLK